MGVEGGIGRCGSTKECKFLRSIYWILFRPTDSQSLNALTKHSPKQALQ